MKYVVDVNGACIHLALEQGGVRIDGALVPAHLEPVEGTPLLVVQADGRPHQVTVRRGAGRGTYTLWIDGYRHEVEAVDERTRAIRDLAAAAAGPVGPKPLVAPMPGLIVRVHVAEGDRVEAGQALVAMEAMKMENELRAASGGQVRRVLVRQGQPVERGMTLVELE